jgi:hypothetical protein
MRAGFIAKALCIQLLFSLCASNAWASACIAPPASEEAIKQFKTNPDALIAPSADTRTIETIVRDLTASNASLAAEFVRLAKRANPRFRTAIAAGLAQAAVACTTIDQQAALLIQQAVASFEDGEFQNAFAAVAGDLSTAATAAATAAADSSVGSVAITNPTSRPPGNTNFSGGGSPSFFQIASGVAISPSASASTTTLSGSSSAASPVSPTH